MSMLSTMWTCHWAGRRIQRYLDADPAAPLSAKEIDRLRAHLAVCERCSSAAEDYQGIRRALATWATRAAPDAERITRVRDSARSLIARDSG